MSGCAEALVSKRIKFPGLFRIFGKERYNCIMELDNYIRTNIKTLKTYNFILEIIYFENNSLTLLRNNIVSYGKNKIISRRKSLA